MAIDYLGALPSTWQTSHEDHEMKARGGSAAVDDVAKAEAEVQLKQSDWKPPNGYAPAMAVYTDEGKQVPRTTVQQWIDQDKPEKKQDPVTHAVYIPETWLKGRLDKYCPRERN